MVVVAFVHPDLGIGGAERLVVDAALALKTRQHKVHIFTAHHDSSHCFQETKDGAIEVTCCGDWLPRHVLGSLYALFAYMRMVYVALYLVFFSKYDPDVIFCDQISVCIPVFRMFSQAKILFYCHFPDQLLTQRKSFAKKLYRAPLDWLEEKSTGMADCVLVNSNFTAQTFFRTFTSLTSINPRVLYPSLNFKTYDANVDLNDNMDGIPTTAKIVFLSINRFERKKNLQLALQALRNLKSKISAHEWETTHLVMAGGYDERVIENKEHYLELVKFAEENNLHDHVTFIRSFSDQEKLILFKRSSCLIYTPTNEHFGIVPIEAMYMKRPVIAVNTGGPLETVLHEESGFLCEPNEEAFSNAMQKVIRESELVERFGKKGREHVTSSFSFAAFGDNLEESIAFMVGEKTADKSDKRESRPLSSSVLWFLFIFLGIIVMLLIWPSS